MSQSSEPKSLYQDSTPTAALEDRYVGIRVLWLKVIIRSVFDWVSYRDSNKPWLKKYADAAASWLFVEGDYFNSFTNICAQLDLSPSLVRKWARSMSKDMVTKMEHLERDHVVSTKAIAKTMIQQFTEIDEAE